jgi:predicted enzyme related to lactoylglutathione lyase
MPEVTSYTTGRPCWADVTSPDVDAAAEFYAELFGWVAEKDPRSEAGGYTMFSRNGKHVAAASLPQQEGIPPHWTVYLASDDVEATAAAIREAGGTVLLEPFDVFDSGRMSVAADPGGAAFGIWQAGSHVGSQLASEPGTLNWAEVQTRDRGSAQPFYERVFGYTSETMEMGPSGEYVVFNLGGRPTAGLVEIRSDWGDGTVPSNWSVVFEVAECDPAVAKVQELGGSLLHGPGDIPGIGRFAVVADPWGAVFQVVD